MTNKRKCFVTRTKSLLPSHSLFLWTKQKPNLWRKLFFIEKIWRSWNGEPQKKRKNTSKHCNNLHKSLKDISRGIFRNHPNIYDVAFCKQSTILQKCSIIDVCQDFKNASGFLIGIQFTKALWLLNRITKAEYDLIYNYLDVHWKNQKKKFVLQVEIFFLHLLAQKQKYYFFWSN